LVAVAVVRLAELPDVLTVTEAAEFLRLGRNSVYQAIQRKELPSVRVGRRVLIPKESLERFLAAPSERT
jgi:excisionase family DNA binding protein